MKMDVMLSIRGVQRYAEQEPDTIELITEGTLEQRENGWEIVYQESNLTGLEGVTTSFLMEPEQIVLTRTGPLKSQMVFALNQPHESLYEMEFGALMLSVCATKMHYAITPQGGTVDLNYRIEIEQSSAGDIEYHLDIKPM